MPAFLVETFGKSYTDDGSDGIARKCVRFSDGISMTLGGYLWGLKISTLVAFCGWLAVARYVDPDVSGGIGIGLFFTMLFLWMAGVSMIVTTRLTEIFFGEEYAATFPIVAIRRGALAALLAVALALLRYFGVLAFWNGALVASALLLLELYGTHGDRKTIDE
jgi:hypothetical protein